MGWEVVYEGGGSSQSRWRDRYVRRKREIAGHEE